MADKRFKEITAKYPGRCAECKTPFEPGEVIVYDTEERRVYCWNCGEDLSE